MISPVINTLLHLRKQVPYETDCLIESYFKALNKDYRYKILKYWGYGYMSNIELI